MKNFFSTFCFLLIFAISSCQQQTKVDQNKSISQNLDSLKIDEQKFPIEHNYLILPQRALIRPIYEEIEKNKKARLTGYILLLNLKNNSKFTTYQNPKLHIEYFNTDGKLKDTENISLKANLKPQKVIKLTAKLKKFKNTNYKVFIDTARVVSSLQN